MPSPHRPWVALLLMLLLQLQLLSLLLLQLLPRLLRVSIDALAAATEPS
jgi:hypothetical protein